MCNCIHVHVNHRTIKNGGWVLHGDGCLLRRMWYTACSTLFWVGWEPRPLGAGSHAHLGGVLGDEDAQLLPQLVFRLSLSRHKFVLQDKGQDTP